MKRKTLVFCTLLVLLVGILGMSIALNAHAAAPDAKAHVTKKVTITSTFLYSPATLTIKVGTTVVWKNASAAAHTVTDGTKVKSPVIAPGGTFSFTFTKKGTYSYHCIFHSFMKGTIVVQ